MNVYLTGTLGALITAAVVFGPWLIERLTGRQLGSMARIAAGLLVVCAFVVYALALRHGMVLRMNRWVDGTFGSTHDRLYYDFLKRRDHDPDIRRALQGLSWDEREEKCIELAHRGMFRLDDAAARQYAAIKGSMLSSAVEPICASLVLHRPPPPNVAAASPRPEDQLSLEGWKTLLDIRLDAMRAEALQQPDRRGTDDQIRAALEVFEARIGTPDAVRTLNGFHRSAPDSEACRAGRTLLHAALEMPDPQGVVLIREFFMP